MNCFICDNKAKIERENIYTKKFTCDFCGLYYTELGFEYQVEKFFHLYGRENHRKLLDLMQEKVKKEKIIFTFDFTETFTNVPDAIYVEIEDLTNKLGIIFMDTNNRGTRYL
jgi:hypothetical protein